MDGRFLVLKLYIYIYIPTRVKSVFDSFSGGDEVRIVILGKSGVGKSSVGNTILGEEVFETTCSPQSQTCICERKEKIVNGRRIVVTDTPGIFDTDRPEKDLREEIISCLVACAPGPHVVILVFKIETHTKDNQKALEKLLGYFTDQIFDHMVVLFTHGNDLSGDMTVLEFVNNFYVRNKKSGVQTLKELVEKCGNRVHVFDNKHWNKDSSVLALLTELTRLNISEQALIEITEKMQSQQIQYTDTLLGQERREEESSEYRSNQFQLNQLMESISTIMEKNNGEPYSNKTLEESGKAIKIEVNNIIQELRDAGENTEDLVEIRRRAVERVRTKTLRLLSGVATGALLGALLGVGVGVAAPVVLIAGLIRAGWRKITHQTPQAGGESVARADVGAGAAAAGVGVATAVTAEVAVAVTEGAMIGAGVGTGIGAAIGAGVLLLYGAGKGLKAGYDEAKTSDNPKQAADNVSQAVGRKAEDALKVCWNLGKKDTEEEADDELLNF